MIIAIIAGGSRGDVQPYVALGKGLKDAGHTVRLLTTEDFRELAAGYGLEIVATGDNIQAATQAEVAALLDSGNLIKILAMTGRGARQMAIQTASAGLEACRDADLLLGGLGGLTVGLALSEKLGKPFVPAYLFPLTPTREFPSILTPMPQTPLSRVVNGLTHRAAQQVLWQTFRSADAKVRSEVLQLPRTPVWGPFGTQSRSAAPVLYGFSRHVIPAPRDWPDTTHVTGYWFLDPPTGWQPPAELAAFLAAGPPPVYIGFGSMRGEDPAATTALLVQALERTGQRGLLAAGWGALRQRDLPENMLMIEAAPHSWLFPNMAAVVHHGGAGTTAAGLASGVPSIVTPFFGDQPFWGRRVYELGVGPRPIPRRRLTADRLAEAITSAVSDRAMQARAAQLGAQIRAEDGVGRAVALIEEQYGR